MTLSRQCVQADASILFTQLCNIPVLTAWVPPVPIPPLWEGTNSLVPTLKGTGLTLAKEVVLGGWRKRLWGGAGEETHLVKYLPHKPEDLSLHSQHSCEKPCVVVCTWKPTNWEADS